MRAPQLFGAVSLSLLLASCAAQPGSQQSSEQSAPSAAATASSAAAPTPTGTSTIQSALTEEQRENLKFYKGDSEDFQTLDDLKKTLTFDADKYPKQIETIPLVVERMQAAANYAPSEKSVRASLNKPTEQLSIDDYMLVYEEYLKAHDVMFSTKGGDFYDTLYTAARQTAYEHLVSENADEAVPYAVTMEIHTNNTGLRISDNSVENSVGDNVLSYLGDYRLMSAGRDIVTDNGNWYVAGNMKLIKKTQ